MNIDKRGRVQWRPTRKGSPARRDRWLKLSVGGGEHGKKEKQIAVEGRVEFDQWQNKEPGVYPGSGDGVVEVRSDLGSSEGRGWSAVQLDTILGQKGRGVEGAAQREKKRTNPVTTDIQTRRQGYDNRQREKPISRILCTPQ